MSNKLVSFRITDKNVDVYQEFKNNLPCINCNNSATCFLEKQATKRARYLKFTVELSDPCPEAKLEMDQIINLARDLVIPLPKMNEMDINDLFYKAVNYYYSHRDLESGFTSFFMFKKVIEKNSEYISYEEGDNAHYYLAQLYHNLFKEPNWDAAIEHFTKGLELYPNDAISFEARGVCWIAKKNLKNALADWKKALAIGHEGLSITSDDIKDIENRLKGSKHN
jgi:tetratricopeptide (TPR) repeat protein